MARLQLRFKFNWKLTLFTFSLVPLLCYLGLWQLSRAEEKRSLQEAERAQQALPPADYAANSVPADFRLVRAWGEFDRRRYWLIEAKQQQGRLGYEVLMPFETVEGWLLVNRGWVPAGKYREDTPVITTPAGRVRLTGSLVSPSDSPLIEQPPGDTTPWPRRILEIDVDILSRQFGAPLAPKVLRIDASDPAAFSVDWRSINMPPEKHTAYAVQWFSLAFVLALMWLLTSSNLPQLMASKRASP